MSIKEKSSYAIHNLSKDQERIHKLIRYQKEQEFKKPTKTALLATIKNDKKVWKRYTFEEAMYKFTGKAYQNTIANLKPFFTDQTHAYVVGKTKSGKTRLLMFMAWLLNGFFGETIIWRETEKQDVLLMAQVIPKEKFIIWLPEGIKIISKHISP
ncbi:MAG: hypothetical protein ACTSUW_02370, partial [Candidatus Heimdallarchaeota archaeon]